VGQGSAELAKDYNPEQPRDWRGRFGEGGGEAKAKAKSGGVQTADASANALLPMIGLGPLGAAIIGHATSNSARKKPVSGSQTPVSPSTSDEPEKDRKPDREPRFRGDNLGPELGKPGALPPDDPRQPAVAPLVPTKDESSETPTKEGEEASSTADNASALKTVEGALPNAENAVIDPKKIYDYVLNPEIRDGGPKAELLSKALGFDRSNGDELIAQIRQGVVNNPAVERQTDLYGTRFAVDMPITSSNRNTEIVRTGWIIDPDSSTPRLTSAYIRGRKKIKKVSGQDSRFILNDIVKSVGEAVALLPKAIAAPEQSFQGDESVPYSELDRVALTVDVPERGLRAGAVGVVMHVHAVPDVAYEVEFFDEEGEPIFPFAVLPEQVRLVWEYKGRESYL
jgi:hypothetical protein